MVLVAFDLIVNPGVREAQAGETQSQSISTSKRSASERVAQESSASEERGEHITQHRKIGK